MIFRLRSAAACAFALMALAPSAHADTAFSDAQKKEIGDIVRQYLMDNPEILLDVSRVLEAKQQQADEDERTADLRPGGSGRVVGVLEVPVVGRDQFVDFGQQLGAHQVGRLGVLGHRFGVGLACWSACLVGKE